MNPRVAPKLLIVGWDAADWHIIDPLLARGAMPNLKRLIEAGVRADLKTLEPKLSPLLWSSIATGKTADKHGILNFVEPHPSGTGVRVVASTSRKTKALWNILTQAGLRVNVVSWYASHPAEPISGCCVSNLFREGIPAQSATEWPCVEGSIHAPEGLRARLEAARVHPQSIKHSEIKRLLPDIDRVSKHDKRPSELAGKWAQALSVHAAAMELADSTQSDNAWDCMMVFHESIDTIGHHFMELRPPRMQHVSKDEVNLFGEVMDRVYIRHDELLGALLAGTGSDTSVILISDHGFYSGTDRPVTEAWRNESGAVLEARWHRPEGVIVLSGPGFRKGEKIAAPSLLDITPTALVALGLPIASDMDGRVIVEAFESTPSIESIPSWDSKPGESGMHSPNLQQDPFEAIDALKQLVDLGYMPAMGDDQERLLALTRRESRCNLAVVLMTTSRHRQAMPIFEELATAMPEEPRYVIPLAQCQHAVQDYGGAVRTLQTFLGRVPNQVDARIVLASALAAMSDTSAADAEIERLEKEHGTRPAMAQPLAELLASRNRWSDAERYYQVAQQTDPKNTAIRLGRARCALVAKEYERAAEHCLDAAEIHMALPEAHFLLGVSLAWLGDLANATLSLENAVRMQPGHLDAQRFLAAVSGAAGDPITAERANEAATALASQLAASGIEPPHTEFAWCAKQWQEETAAQ